MSKVGISLNINVSEIEKGRLFKGAKGTYLNATVFVDLSEADQHGNHGMITQDVNKEERQNGIKGAILGNCKVFWQGESNQQQKPQQPQQSQQQGQQAPQNNTFDDCENLPF